MTLNHLAWLGFLGGLLSFAHCLGMCGGFVLHLSQRRSGSSMPSLLLWHTGRLFTYVFLGALAAYAGKGMRTFLDHVWLRDAMAWLTGGVIILMGLMVLGLLPARSRHGGTITWFQSVITTAFLPSASPRTALVFGIATGCLPCPIIVGFLAYALETGSVPAGMAVMAGVGTGTLVPLLLLSAVGQVTLAVRSLGRVAGGVLLILLGTVTMLRGTDTLHRFLGCKETTVGSATGATSPPACCSHGNNARRSH